VPADLERLEELCAMVRHTSLCGLGQAAPSPVLSTLRWFRAEYEAACLPGAGPWP
jgi:bidirectional [NiFe] hydrogenase diaphorase subunit